MVWALMPEMVSNSLIENPIEIDYKQTGQMVGDYGNAGTDEQRMGERRSCAIAKNEEERARVYCKRYG